MLIPSEILKGKGMCVAHLNYGHGRGGYLYQHAEHRRLQWIDKHGPWDRPPMREWKVDGNEVGIGPDGLINAIKALEKEVVITDAERLALTFIHDEPTKLRTVEAAIREALVREKLIDEDGSRAYVFHVMYFLKFKGLVIINRDVDDDPAIRKLPL